VKGKFGASLRHLAPLADVHLFAPTESDEIRAAMREDAAVSKKRLRSEVTDTQEGTQEGTAGAAGGTTGAGGGTSAPSSDSSERIGYGWRRIAEGKNTTAEEKEQDHEQEQEDAGDQSSVHAAAACNGLEVERGDAEESCPVHTHELVVRCPLGVSSFKEGTCCAVLCCDMPLYFPINLPTNPFSEFNIPLSAVLFCAVP
jgi:hypothetical protein